MVPDIVIRPARFDEQAMLESLQRRASLNNPGDRDALLANPDAIAIPIEQITDGCVFVAEGDGSVAGFAAVVPRPDGGAEWTPCSSSRTSGSRGLDDDSSSTLPGSREQGPRPFCTSSAIHMRKASTSPVAFV